MGRCDGQLERWAAGPEQPGKHLFLGALAANSYNGEQWIVVGVLNRDSGMATRCSPLGLAKARRSSSPRSWRVRGSNVRPDKLVEIGGTMRNGEREQPRGLSLWLVPAGLSDCPRMGAVVR